MITRENYESYFTDYLDGTLSPSEVRDVKTFLLVNPDLEEQLENIIGTTLISPQIQFTNKKLLKKEVYHECPDYYAIATAENVLTQDEQKQIRNRCKDADFKELVDSYLNLKLTYNPNILFEKKTVLYRGNRHSSISFLKISSVAAVLLLLLGIGINIFHPIQTEIIPTDRERIPPVTPAESYPIAIAECRIQPQLTKIKLDIPNNSLTDKSYPLIEEKVDVVEIIPIQEIVTVNFDIPISLPTKFEQTLKVITPEIILSQNAEEWKPSHSNIQTKDIFTETLNAGKNIVERIKNRDFAFENFIPHY